MAILKRRGGLGPASLDETVAGNGLLHRRALLGRALVCDPELLLLDEPTNHLDIEAIEWLEEFLKEFQGALLFVSHDRRFVNNLATRIIDLDRGTLSSWPGNYDAYAQKKAEQLANEQLAKSRGLGRPGEASTAGRRGGPPPPRRWSA